MDTYEFTLFFNLPDSVCSRDDQIDSLFGAGLDDVVIGIGAEGRLSLECVRDSDTALNAVFECIRSAEAAIAGIELVAMAPNFIGVSDIAAMFEMSRQNIAKHFRSNNGNLPPIPVYTGDKLLWHTVDALGWLKDCKGFDVSSSVLDVAKVSKSVNGYINYVGSTSGIFDLANNFPNNLTRVVPESKQYVPVIRGFAESSVSFSVVGTAGTLIEDVERVNFLEDSKNFTVKYGEDAPVLFDPDPEERVH